MTGAAMRVDPANAGQARGWDGDEGTYWAEHAQRFDRAVAAYHGTFMVACGIARGERVLDIGCGTGQTTRDAAGAARPGQALGVDLSAPMIELARRLAAGQDIGNVSFEQADAQIHPFPAGSFDVAISRTGTMFFGDPAAAFTNIGRALRPGGRLVMLAWQGPGPNEWVRELSGALAAGRDLLRGHPRGRPGPTRAHGSLQDRFARWRSGRQPRLTEGPHPWPPSARHCPRAATWPRLRRPPCYAGRRNRARPAAVSRAPAAIITSHGAGFAGGCGAVPPNPAAAAPFGMI